MAATSYSSEQTTKSTKASMGISNRIVCLLNVLSMLCSFPFLGAGIWLATRHGTDCVRSLMWPIIAIGLFVLLFSLVGLIGSCLRIKILLWLYLAVTLLIIVLLLCATIFAFVVTSRGSGESVSDRQFQEYRLDRYTKWLQHEVSELRHWEKIKACIQNAKVCQKLNYTDSASFFNANLSPLQSGCCKPPTACNFNFVNATYWIRPTTAPASDQNADCGSWSNDQSELCYNCDSCQAGVAENIRLDWGKMALVGAVLLIFLIVIYTLGCCAVKNSNKNQVYEKQTVVSSSTTEDGHSEKRRTVHTSRV